MPTYGSSSGATRPSLVCTPAVRLGRRPKPITSRCSLSLAMAVSPAQRGWSLSARCPTRSTPSTGPSQSASWSCAWPTSTPDEPRRGCPPRYTTSLREEKLAQRLAEQPLRHHDPLDLVGALV